MMMMMMMMMMMKYSLQSIIYVNPDAICRKYLRTSEETAVRISHSVFTTNWFKVLQSTIAFT